MPTSFGRRRLHRIRPISALPSGAGPWAGGIRPGPPTKYPGGDRRHTGGGGGGLRPEPLVPRGSGRGGPCDGKSEAEIHAPRLVGRGRPPGRDRRRCHLSGRIESDRPSLCSTCLAQLVARSISLWTFTGLNEANRSRRASMPVSASTNPRCSARIKRSSTARSNKASKGS
jgi:hypothetical protein